MTLAMLAPAGAALMAAPAAEATTFTGSYNNGGASYADSFTFDAMPYSVDSFSAQYTLTSDTGGNAFINFSSFGAVVLLDSGGNNDKLDFFVPIYNGNPAAPVLTPGVYSGQFGSTLTLSVSGAPEPDAWALMVAGVAMAGGAARVARRRRQTVSPASANA